MFEFADRIAEVADGSRFHGYLHVTVPEMLTRGGTTYVDMVFARARTVTSSGGTKTADPGTASAQQELAAAELDWYGERFSLHWLDGEAAVRVRRGVFHHGGERA